MSDTEKPWLWWLTADELAEFRKPLPEGYVYIGDVLEGGDGDWDG